MHVVYSWWLRDHISCPSTTRRYDLDLPYGRTNIIAAWRRTCIRGNKVSTVIMTGSLPARRYGIWSANEWTRRTKGWLVRSCISVSFVNRLRIYIYLTYQLNIFYLKIYPVERDGFFLVFFVSANNCIFVNFWA